MQIIEIQQTRSGEVAYVFDEIKGRVIKLPVEDLTGYTDDTHEDQAPIRRPITRRRTMAEVEDAGEDMPTERVTRKLPDKPKSIMPPGMAGIFREAGMPGAAIEVRKV